jgi:hypothetical protein
MRSILSLILIFIAQCPFVYAEIKNGYSNKLEKVRKAITNYRLLVDEYDPDKSQLRNAQKQLKELRETEKCWQLYFIKTEQLISELQDEFPALFHEIDTIKNADGIVTDIYVSVVEQWSLCQGAYATTNFKCCKENPNSCLSEFGPNTVSIIIDERRNTMTRSFIHELGHVLYLVPNLKSYLDYYHENYTDFFIKKHGNRIGHKSNDPSHKVVMEVLRRYDSLKRRKPI